MKTHHEWALLTSPSVKMPCVIFVAIFFTFRISRYFFLKTDFFNYFFWREGDTDVQYYGNARRNFFEKLHKLYKIKSRGIISSGNLHRFPSSLVRHISFLFQISLYFSLKQQRNFFLLFFWEGGACFGEK